MNKKFISNWEDMYMIFRGTGEMEQKMGRVLPPEYFEKPMGAEG